MDTDMRCNRITCRANLVDQAVVTTCSHIFCLPCATESFTANPQVCPACECFLPEPDDCMSTSLHPTNDYKTSVLSGLGPSTIVDIAGRAMAFWSYQMHQEHAYQQAALKHATEKMAYIQKQLDNVIREANTELSLLNSKVVGLERELDLERRKLRELQENSREKDKEYAKLKNQYDKIKRKALMNPNALTTGGQPTTNSTPLAGAIRTQTPIRDAQPQRATTAMTMGLAGPGWPAAGFSHATIPSATQHRQPFGAALGMSHGEANASAEEVESMLGMPISHRQAPPGGTTGRAFALHQPTAVSGFGGVGGYTRAGGQHGAIATPSTVRRSGGSKPAFGGFNGA